MGERGIAERGDWEELRLNGAREPSGDEARENRSAAISEENENNDRPWEEVEEESLEEVGELGWCR